MSQESDDLMRLKLPIIKEAIGQAAQVAHAYFISLVKEGFTRAEALQLVMSMLNQPKKSNPSASD